MESQGLLFAEFLETPAGRFLSCWEKREVGRVAECSFGCAALQVGLPGLDLLASSPVPARFHAPLPGEEGPADLFLRPEELPFREEDLDLVVLAHTLDFAAGDDEAGAALAEAARVLAPEGRVIVTVFNRTSLWCLRERAARAGVGGRYLPRGARPLRVAALRNWFDKAGLDIDRGRFGGYLPPVRSSSLAEKSAWMNLAGDRWWPSCGALVMLSAKKRRLRAYMAGSEALPRRRVETGAAQPVASSAMERSSGEQFFTGE